MAASMDDGLESEDFYTLLNLDRKATKEEITSAFRRMSKIYHPDKHLDPLKKKNAEAMFNKMKTAHEVLKDPNKREIYDRFGKKGLEVDGLELMTRVKSPAEIIAELNRYQKEQEERKLQQRTNPRGNITVGIRATDLFESYEENDYGSYGSGVEINSMSINQSVECPLTPKDTAVISGALSTQNGRGMGAFTGVWRRLTSDKGWMEGEVTVGSNISFGLRWFYQINRRCFCTCTCGLMSTQHGLKPGFTSLIACQLDRNLQGRLMWTVGYPSSMKTILVYDCLGHHATLTLQIGLPASFGQVVYVKTFQEDDAKIRLGAKVGTFGAVVEYGCEKKISQFSSVRASMMVGVPIGVILHIRVTRGQQIFNFPIHISEGIVPSAVVYGTLLPNVIYFAMKKLIIDPYIKKEDEAKQQKTKEERAQQLQENKREAEAAIELMQETVERSVENEEKKSGLIIIKALYGKLVTQEDGELDDTECIDVRIPLQVLVKDSTLILNDTKSKSDIPGFYDPCPEKEKRLYIRYSFRKRPHQVTLGDTEPIRLPLQKHFMKNETV